MDRSGPTLNRTSFSLFGNEIGSDPEPRPVGKVKLYSTEEFV
jgi:hypothetical protein